VEEFTEPLEFEERGAILHRLNREATSGSGKKVLLKAEEFAKSVSKWNGTPIIFAKEHPQGGVGSNLARKLSEVQGRLLGAVANAEVITEGSPRLVAKLDLVKDREFDALNKAGKLEISPAWRPSDAGPIPDHVLVFPSGEGHEPGDKGAMMFQRLKEDPKEFAVNLLNAAKQFVSKEESEMSNEVEDLKKQVEAFQNTEKQKEAELSAFKEKVKALEAEKVEKEKKLQEFIAAEDQKRKDSAFNDFANKAPPAWKTGKEKVKNEKGEEVEVERFASLRKKFEADPNAAYKELVAFIEKQDLGEGVDGQQNAGGAAPKKRGTVGRWNHLKHEFTNE
jgi:hypothetical protein